MESLPLYISITFAATTGLAVWFFYRAARFSRAAFIVILSWLVLQAVAGLGGFYTVSNTVPPRFLFLIIPPLLTITLLFITKRGRAFIDSLSPSMLTLLHIVRIPVEVVLYWLFIHKGVPQVMTFEGANFDILSGISAPVVFYLGYVKKQLNDTSLLVWNLVCLILVFTIVVIAILSSPLPIQQFGFDQPNIGVQYFPFNWLPSVVVPLVILAHLSSIRYYFQKKVAAR